MKKVTLGMLHDLDDARCLFDKLEHMFYNHYAARVIIGHLGACSFVP